MSREQRNADRDNMTARLMRDLGRLGTITVELKPHGLFKADLEAVASWEIASDEDILAEIVNHIYEGTEYTDAGYWQQYPRSALVVIVASEVGVRV